MSVFMTLTEILREIENGKLLEQANDRIEGFKSFPGALSNRKGIINEIKAYCLVLEALMNSVPRSVRIIKNYRICTSVFLNCTSSDNLSFEIEIDLLIFIWYLNSKIRLVIGETKSSGKDLRKANDQVTYRIQEIEKFRNKHILFRHNITLGDEKVSGLEITPSVQIEGIICVAENKISCHSGKFPVFNLNDQTKLRKFLRSSPEKENIMENPTYASIVARQTRKFGQALKARN